MSMSAPRSVMAFAAGLVEMTVAPAPIVSVPLPSSPVPSALTSAARLNVLVPLLTIAPAATDQVRPGRDVDRRVDRATVNAAQCQAPQAVQKYAAGLVRRADRPITTFCCAVLALSANWIRLPLVPIGPIVLSVTVPPVVAISAVALLALAATMPPVPAFRLIVPPLPFRAVPVPAPSSRMIWPAPPRGLDDQGGGPGGGGHRGGREA